MEIRVICSECDGTGQTPPNPPFTGDNCRECGGDGYHARIIHSPELEDVLNDFKTTLADILERVSE
jgi:hypothetical protein